MARRSVWVVQVADEKGFRHPSYYVDPEKAQARMAEVLRDIAEKLTGVATKMEGWEPFTEIVRRHIEGLRRTAGEIRRLVDAGDVYGAYETWLVLEAESEGVFIPPLRSVTGSISVDVR